MSYNFYQPTKVLYGAGLIMISLEYYKYFVEKHVCDDRFIAMAKALGIADASDPIYEESE